LIYVIYVIDYVFYFIYFFFFLIFILLLLLFYNKGRGGESLKRIEATTHCKVQIPQGKNNIIIY